MNVNSLSSIPIHSNSWCTNWPLSITKTNREPDSQKCSTITFSLQSSQFIGPTMTTDLDPVVALATAFLSGFQSIHAGLICSSKASSNFILGFHNRTCEVFDALATLCVCKPKLEVITIGSHYLKPTTELIIASNNGSPLELTLNYLRTIWRLLQVISSRMPSGNKIPIDKRGKSREFDFSKSHCNTTVHKLFNEIFKNSFMVAQKCSKKYIPIVNAFHQ